MAEMTEAMQNSDPLILVVGKAGLTRKWLNPTNGSWWIVQIPLSPNLLAASEAGPEVSTNCRWWD
jgi:hypothetical protein